jgi:nicotinamide riboside transporter PnuC
MRLFCVVLSANAALTVSIVVSVQQHTTPRNEVGLFFDVCMMFLLIAAWILATNRGRVQ